LLLSKIISSENVVTPTTSRPPPSISTPPARTLIPTLAVAIPTESTFLTSSYVKTPPTVTFPEKFAVVPLIPPEKVVTPAILTLSKFV